VRDLGEVAPAAHGARIIHSTIAATAPPRDSANENVV
jgi:hypothetical protein